MKREKVRGRDGESEKWSRQKEGESEVENEGIQLEEKGARRGSEGEKKAPQPEG